MQLRMYRIKDLKKLIAGLPDDTIILRGPIGDHSYRLAEIFVETAMYDKEYGYSEDFGEDATPEGEFGKRVEVLIVG